jgi:transcriptional regulator with XRE-family HTH domain
MPNSKDAYKKIGEAIKLVRINRKLTQEYMSTQLGYSDRGSYAKLERGENTTLDALQLIRICNLLQCNLVHLLMLAGINVFETPLETYTEFEAKLESIDE